MNRGNRSSLEFIRRNWTFGMAPKCLRLRWDWIWVWCRIHMKRRITMFDLIIRNIPFNYHFVQTKLNEKQKQAVNQLFSRWRHPLHKHIAGCSRSFHRFIGALEQFRCRCIGIIAQM